jgi:CotS family spore coat protein
LYDRGLGVLEQYGLEAKSVTKGRGALICETEQGLKTIREYWGSPKKMELQQKLQLQCRQMGQIQVDLVLSNQEGQVITTNQEGIPYVVRDWFRGRECDVRSADDIRRSLCALADLHNVMQMEQEEPASGSNLIEECRKHNRELRKIRKFLQKKKRKTVFEEKLAQSIPVFLEQGEKTVERLAGSDYSQLVSQNRDKICHGDCNQHNILFTKEGIAFTNFEHWNYDVQTADLYQFMRKILEKYNWNQEMGREMLKTYESRRMLSEAEVENLRLWLSYPWKYWKIANFYANSNKVWISQKNTEKLLQTIALLEPWKCFIDKF